MKEIRENIKQTNGRLGIQHFIMLKYFVKTRENIEEIYGRLGIQDFIN